MPALCGMACGRFGRMGAIGAVSYNPLGALGSDLLAWWDADPSYWGAKGSIALGPTRVSSWSDVVGGYNMANSDVTEGTRPIWSASQFNGGYGVTFDGVDDLLALSTAPSQFPGSANPSELWVLAQNDATAGARIFFGYGASNTTGRSVGVNSTTARAYTGDGTGFINTDFAVGGFTTGSRGVERGQFGATQTTGTFNGATPVSNIVVPSTTLTRLRVGAGPTGTAGANFAQGTVVAAIITNPLGSDRAPALQTWLISRRRP